MQAVPPALLKIKTDFNFVNLVFLMVSGSDLGLRISDKKYFLGRRNRRNKWFVPMELRSKTIPRKIKMLGIPYRGTKKEAL
jgi:hypothetical protein